MTLFFRCFINPDSRYRWIRNDARLYKLRRARARGTADVRRPPVDVINEVSIKREKPLFSL